MEQQLLDLTYQACDAFKAQETYKRILKLKEMINQDPEVNDLIAEFQKIKKKYEEAKTYGQYHPD